MDPETFAAWLFGVSLLVLGLAAAAQAALVYIDRARLRHLLDEGAQRAAALAELLDAPTSTLSTVLLVYTLALATGTASAFWLVLGWWPVAPAVGVAVGAGAFFALLLAQFLGRLVAISRPERVALAFVRPVEVLTRAFTLVLFPLIWLERTLGRLLGLRRGSTPAEAEERLRHLVEDTTELEEGEREMIASVIELGEEPVREVMVPRIDIRALPDTATVAQAMDRIVETGHSRLPIFTETVDNIVGVVYAKDVLRHLRSGGTTEDQALALAREPHFVPETKKVDELLQEMRVRRVHMAVVADEYGGTAGLITFEDLIEEIVGEIQDEYDVQEEAPISQLSETEALFDGRVSIRDVNDTLDAHIDDEDFDTIGGLIYHELGKVPNVGDEVRVDGLVVTVLATTGRRIRKVRAVKAAVVPEAPVAPTAAAGERPSAGGAGGSGREE